MISNTKKIKKTKRRRKKGRYHMGTHVSPIAGECKYRSGWEAKYMQYLDTNPDIVTWSYEKIAIPYVSNKRTGKLRNYYPDFMIENCDGTRNIIEIKPSKKLSHVTVKKKVQAAEIWCSDHGFTYKILTEIELKDMSIILS